MKDMDETYLQAYIRGELSPEEMAAADARVQAEPAFAQVVAETRMLMELARMARIQDARAEAVAAQERFLAQSKRMPRRRALYIAVTAAAAVLLLVIGYYAWPPAAPTVPSRVLQPWKLSMQGHQHWLSKPTRGQYLFATTFQPKETNQSTLGASASLAYQQYDDGHYDSALVSLRQLTPLSDTTQFYIAQCQLALDSAALALAGFEAYQSSHQSDPEGALFQESQWYIALALLALDRVEEARRALEVIVSGEGKWSHRDEARNMIRRMD